MSDEFYELWVAARNHLNCWVDSGLVWIRSYPHPVYREHLSFRFGNQLFFVRVMDAFSKIVAPGTLEGLRHVVEKSGGHGCVLPMVCTETEWKAMMPNWGLISPEDGSLIDPSSMLTNDIVPMSDWEVQDLAVQVVRDYLSERGMESYSWDSDPESDPSIWFVDQDGRPAWVIVRATRHPAKAPAVPSNWRNRAIQFSGMKHRGYFAGIGFANDEDPFHPLGWGALPLWRGFLCRHNFAALMVLHDAGGG